MNTSVTKGSIGTAHCIAHLTSMGYVVSIPLNDNQPYDLIFDDGVKLNKVSVKYTSQKSKTGYYIVELKSVRPNRTKNTIHKFDTSVVDFLFVFCENGDKYFVSSGDLKHTCAMTLTDKQDVFKV